MKLITDLNDRALYAPPRTVDETTSACNRNCVQGRMCDCMPGVECVAELDEPGAHTIMSNVLNVAAISAGFIASSVCRPRVAFPLIVASMLLVHGHFAGWFK